MGLTIHYTLTVKHGMGIRALKKLLLKTQMLARKNGCAHVGKVLHSSKSDSDAPPFFDCRPGRKRRLHGGGRGTKGWLLEVWPGEGCETAVFGVLEYHRELPRRKRQLIWEVRYAKRPNWKLHAWCKTCFAAEHGCENFVQCHLRVIQLLDLWRKAGVTVEVHDGSGYWKSRDRELLVREGAAYEAYFKKYASVLS